jgi:hypothetical protein
MNTPRKNLFYCEKPLHTLFFKKIKPTKHHLFFYVLVQESNPPRWLFTKGNPIRIEFSFPATPP